MSHWTKHSFKRYVREQAARLDVEFGHIAVRNMEQKWASCSLRGNLTFNKELLEMNVEIGEYVVLHELMHLRVPNHGKLWKTYMSLFLKDYKAIEQQMKLVTSCRFN